MAQYRNVTVALREQDIKDLAKLKKLQKGEISNIDIWRNGVADLLARTPKIVRL